MDKLIEALEAEKSELVSMLAYPLFVNEYGTLNYDNASIFELKTGAKVYSIGFGPSGMIGRIAYKGQDYYFG